MPTYNLGHVKGVDGKGIQSITKTGTSGLVDTYTITYTDGSTTTYTVTNGSGGADIATSWGDPVVDTKVPSEKLTKDTLDGKASNSHQHGNLSNDGKIGSTNGKIVVTGTGGVLQASDLKTINNNNLIGSGNIDIQGGGGVDIVTSWESTLSDEKVASEKLTKNTIDTKVSGNKVTSWSGTVSDSNIPSEKLVKDSLDGKADSSDIPVDVSELTDTQNTPFTPKSHTHDDRYYIKSDVDTALTGKQATLVSGTNIKTINGISLLDSGDITVGADAGSFSDLQDIIDEASSGDTIILDKDYRNTGSESEITIIGKALTIIGNGHILDADEKSRIFNITSDGCKINGLIFENGKSNDFGGAINCNSSNTISNCSFINNTANYYGGAINCNSSNTISNCSFINNTANYYGGAINCNSYNNSISDCSFTNNTAEIGGAVNCDSSNNSISDCSFNGNTATEDGANVFNSDSTSLIIYNCHVTTGLYNTVNYDDLNSSKLVTSWSSTVSDTNLASEKLIKDTIDGLSIPTKISDLTNDSDFIETSSTTGLIKNDGSIDTTSYQEAGDYIETSETAGLVKNDGTIDTSAYITNSALSNYIQKSSTSGLVKNDGSIDTNAYLTSSALSNYVQKSSTAGLLKNDGTVDTNTYVDTDDIANNLTTTTAGKVLDARQGKELADLIGNAITYINL